MGLIPLPIAKPNWNIDPASKSIISDAIYDGYIDESGSLRRRGGLKPWVDVGTNAPGYGLYHFKTGDLDVLVARSGAKVFTVAKDGSVEDITGAVVFAQAPTVFAEGNKIDGSPWLYMFDGGHPVWTEGTDCTRLDGSRGCPASVLFGAWADGRFLVAEAGTRKFYATDTDPVTGNIENDYFLAAENPLTAEARPDNIDYLGAFWNELQVWGRQGMEVWQSDTAFFSPVTGAFSEVGIYAPYSVARGDNSTLALCLVDQDKPAVVKMTGRSPQVVSAPIEKLLANLVNEAENSTDSGLPLAVGWVTQDSEYILTFPRSGQTWCYDIKRDAWYRWSKWDEANAERVEFTGRYCVTAWGKTYMQSRLDGTIYEYDRTTYHDDGGAMSTEWRTGQVGRGYKSRCRKLRLQFKRGSVADDAPGEAVLEVKWRDNGSLVWGAPRQVNIGTVGDSVFFKELHRLGTYESRQYAFRLTYPADLALVNAWEDVEVLER